MIRHHARVWLSGPGLSGPGLPAACGLGCAAAAAVPLAIWTSVRSGIPIENITGVMLLMLALAGSGVTTLMLPRRPATVRAARPRRAPTRVPGTRVPASPPGCEAGTPNSQPVGIRLGQRPAAARLPDIPVAAAGPATVPGGAL